MSLVQAMAIQRSSLRRIMTVGHHIHRARTHAPDERNPWRWAGASSVRGCGRLGSYSPISIIWPRPVRARACSAAAPVRPVETGHVIGVVADPGVTGGRSGVAGEEGQSTEGVADTAETRPVLVGSGLSVAADPHHDQARVDLLQDVPAQAPFLQRSRLKVFDENIGLFDQPLENFAGLGLVQIRRDRLLVAALGQPGQRLAAFGDGAELAQRIADLGEARSSGFRRRIRQAASSKTGLREARHVDDTDIV